VALNYHFQDLCFGGRVVIPLQESRIYVNSSERTTENLCLPHPNLLPGLFSLAIFNGVCDSWGNKVDLYLQSASFLLNTRNPQGSGTAFGETAGFSEWLAFLLLLIFL